MRRFETAFRPRPDAPGSRIALALCAALLLCAPGTLLVALLSSVRVIDGAGLAAVLPMATGALLATSLLLGAAYVGARAAG